MEKTQFDTLMLAITGLRTEAAGQFAEVRAEITGLDTKLTSSIAGLKADVTRLESKVDRIQVDVEIIAGQMSKTITEVDQLKRRIDGPSA